MKKSVLVFSLYLLLGFHVTFAAGRSTLQATISAQQTTISELETGNIELVLEISNVGKEAIDTHIADSRLSINNQEIKNWNPYTAMPGVLQPGQIKRFDIYLVRPFTKPGTYKVRWQSENFQSPPLQIKVLRDRVTPAGQERKHFALVRAIRAVLPAGWEAHGEKWPIGQLVEISRLQPTQMEQASMPNMAFDPDYRQKPLPYAVFEISLLTESFIHPAYYQQIEIDNAKIDLLLDFVA